MEPRDKVQSKISGPEASRAPSDRHNRPLQTHVERQDVGRHGKVRDQNDEADQVSHATGGAVWMEHPLPPWLPAFLGGQGRCQILGHSAPTAQCRVLKRGRVQLPEILLAEPGRLSKPLSEREAARPSQGKRGRNHARRDGPEAVDTLGVAATGILLVDYLFQREDRLCDVAGTALGRLWSRAQ